VILERLRHYSFSFLLKCVLVAQIIWRQMKGLVNNTLEWMLKETLVGVLSYYLPGGIEESHVKSQDSRPLALDLNPLPPKTK
jgi:hypothetical protein